MDHQYGTLDLPPIPTSPGWQPRITPSTYVGIQFTMMSLAIVTAAIRTSVRIHKFRRVTVDDVLLVIATLGHVAAVVIAYHATGLVYWTVYINMRLVRPMGNYIDMMRAFSILDNLSNIFAWGSLYLVKISFLVFLRSLVNRVRVIQVYWWVVFTLVILMTPVTMFLGFYICPDFSDNMGVTCGAYIVERQWVFLVVNCCLDIVSDVLILTIPIWLLWKVQVSLARKFALGAVLCLSIFMVVIALIRVTLDNVTAPNGEVLPDTPWLYFWTNVEGSVAVLMVSLTAFRSMLGQGPKQSAYYGSNSNSTGPSSSGNFKGRPALWSGAPASRSGPPEKSSIDMHNVKPSSQDDASDSDDALLPPAPAAVRQTHGPVRTVDSIPLSPRVQNSVGISSSPAPRTAPHRADQLPRISTSPATPTSPLSASLAGPRTETGSYRSASPSTHSLPFNQPGTPRSRSTGMASPPMSPPMSPPALDRHSVCRPLTPSNARPHKAAAAGGYVDPTLSAIRKEITIRTSFEAAPHTQTLPPLVNSHPLHQSDSGSMYMEAPERKEVGVDVV